MEQKKNNSGGLWINKNRTSETHSQMKGNVVIEGQEYWVNAWSKKNDQGETWFSLSFQIKNPIQSGSDQNDKKDFLDFLDSVQ
jgi:hypothetical protein